MFHRECKRTTSPDMSQAESWYFPGVSKTENSDLQNPDIIHFLLIRSLKNKISVMNTGMDYTDNVSFVKRKMESQP